MVIVAIQLGADSAVLAGVRAARVVSALAVIARVTLLADTPGKKGEMGAKKMSRGMSRNKCLRIYIYWCTSLTGAKVPGKRTPS